MKNPVVVAVVCLGALGCGSSASESANPTDAGATDAPLLVDTGTQDARVHDASPVDAAPEASSVDHGAPSTTYPAFPSALPSIVDNGGYVMKSPVIVPITWDGDPSQATLDAYADAIGGTDYWKATTHEYGVGPASAGSARHVHIATTPPASVQDSDLQAMVTSHAGTDWPSATNDTIFAFFLPPGTSLLEPDFITGKPTDSCSQGLGGYHDQLTAGTTLTAYAVVPSCSFGKGFTPEQWTTLSMSHELIEAATDPQPQQTQNGYVGLDANDFGWNYFLELQTEVGDVCEFYPASHFEDKETAPVTFDGFVQRTWSNAAAAAAHDPCVPADTTVPYFNVSPLGLESVGYTVPGILTGGASMSGKSLGVHVAEGGSVTFAVGLYSDRDTGGPWTLSVAPGNPILGSKSFVTQFNPSSVTATIDRTSGQNGEKAYVTVKVASSGKAFGGEIVTVTSTLNGVSRSMPIWIATP